jgi:hypothetical protein
MDLPRLDVCPQKASPFFKYGVPYHLLLQKCTELKAKKGKTAGLLLCMTHQLWGMAKIVLMDSSFCVFLALIELRKKGVFFTTLIKKYRYWPKHIGDDKMDLHVADKEVGTVDALKAN